MLEKIKGLGADVATKANDKVGEITNSVMGGVESLTSSATNVTDTLNEKAVRASAAQMCTVLETALEEVKKRPLSKQPLALTVTVNIGFVSLQMQTRNEPKVTRQKA